MAESDELVVLVVTAVIVVVVVSVMTVVVSDSLIVSVGEEPAWPKHLCIFDWPLCPGLDDWLAIVNDTLKGLKAAIQISLLKLVASTCCTKVLII